MRIKLHSYEAQRGGSRMVVMTDAHGWEGFICEFWNKDKDRFSSKAKRRTHYYKAMARRGLLKAAKIVEFF